MLRLLLIAALAAGGWAYHQRGHGPMDGSAWEVRVRRSSLLSIGRGDTLIFERGRVTAAGSLASGFSAARYDARHSGGAMVWTATSVADSGEAQSWQGVAHGERIEGAVLWTRADGRVTRLRFSGKRRAG